MALVRPTSSRQPAVAMPGAGSAQAAPKQRKHKIIVESVTQEKNKLRTVLTFRAEPPPGYTFIPAGNPELTTALKEFARQGNHKIYAVTTTPHQKTHDLSKEVHRIGFHFPSVVVAQVCAHYGIVLSSQGTLITEDDVEDFRKKRRRGRAGARGKSEDQITINTQARSAIKDLFPKMPDNDLHTIIKTAFQKGQGKVGTANELPLVRRAQLSVVAHIRHVYTKYDRLLREVGYHTARTEVEVPTLRKLIEWRGDDDSDNKVLEDVIREVVVISDDEESDEDDSDTRRLDQEDLSVEVVSSQANHRQTDQQPIDQAPLRRLDQTYISDEDATSAYRYIPQATKRRKTALDSGTPASDPSQHRYAAWDRARKQYRDEPEQKRPPPLVELVPYDPRQYDRQADNPYNDAPHALRHAPSAQHTPDTPYQYMPGRPPTRRSPPRAFRGADGVLYERVDPSRPVADTPVGQLRRRLSSPMMRPPFPSQQELASAQFRPHQRAAGAREESPRFRDGDNVVVPSIESPQYSPTPRNPFRKYQVPSATRRRRDGQQLDAPRGQRPQVIEVVDLSEGSSFHLPKRRRIDDSVGPIRANPFEQGERSREIPNPRGGNHPDLRLFEAADSNRRRDVQLNGVYRPREEVPIAARPSHVVDISPAAPISTQPRRVLLPLPPAATSTREVIDLSSPVVGGPRRVYMPDDALRAPASDRPIQPEPSGMYARARVPYPSDVRTVPHYYDDRTPIRQYVTQRREHETQPEDYRPLRYEYEPGTPRQAIPLERRSFTDPTPPRVERRYEPIPSHAYVQH